MRRLNDYSGVFFRGNVVTGLKLDGVALSPARRVGATSVLSGWVESSVSVLVTVKSCWTSDLFVRPRVYVTVQ